MQRSSLILATLIGFLGASSLVAQTTTPSTEAPANEQKLDQEFPVASENNELKEGDGYLKSSHGKWEVRCIKAPENTPETCRLYNLLNDKDGASVAEINFMSLPSGGKAVAGVDLATPLGTLLTAQVTFKVDNGKARRYQYSWCDQYGCFARFGMTANEIAALKRGAGATITIVSIASPDDPINLDISLSGFTAAWNAIQQKK